MCHVHQNCRLDHPPWEKHYQEAAAVIQRNFRRYKKKFGAESAAAILIQKVYRGWVVSSSGSAALTGPGGRLQVTMLFVRSHPDV